MEEDTTMYGTPAQDTPYMTPVSTPRRILYRANPVKLVRQQVPTKVQPSQDSAQTLTSKEDSISALIGANPMLTKRNRCTVQTSSLSSTDGVSDLVAAEIPERLNTENSVAQRLEFDADVSEHDAHELQFQNNQRTTPCISKGDAETVESNVSSQIKSVERAAMNETFADCHKSSQIIISRNSFEAGMEQVALVEEEIQSLDKKIREALSSLDKNHSSSAKAQIEPNFLDGNGAKSLHLDELVKKNTHIPLRRSISNRENRDNIEAGHKCEKKKFYDPKDIRKYMAKKKNERLAKEKEEKSKRANEIAALKRKTEVNKQFANRVKLHDAAIKEGPTLKNKSSKTIKNDETNRKDDDAGCTVVVSRRSNLPVRCKTNANDELIGTYAKESDTMKKSASTAGESYLASSFSKSTQTPIGKIDDKFARTVNVLHGKTNHVIEPNRIKSKDDEDSEKRLKLDAPAVQHGYDNVVLAHLKQELTLSDLNLNETYKVRGNEDKSDFTFVVPNFESRRKPTKQTVPAEDTKENMSCSLELSGVKPLPCFKPFVSTPLSEKNTNRVDRREETSNRLRLSASARKRSEGDTADGVTRQTLESHQKSIESDLKRVMSLESLKVQDVSFLSSQSYRLDRNSTDGVTLLDDNGECKRRVRSGAANAIESDAESEVKNSHLFDDPLQINSSTVLVDLYDQMIKSEDEKLFQIMKKIQQQKEALNKYLRSEVFSLELQKNQHRERKDEEKIKTIKKKQRGILLKVTKNIIELDKMKKSVIEMVEKRKAELLKQKISAKEGRIALETKSPTKGDDVDNKTILISKQTTNTIFGFSSSSCTSLILENENAEEKRLIANQLRGHREDTGERVERRTSFGTNNYTERIKNVKDSATSPVQFNAGISIRFDLDAEKLLQLKNSQAEIKIRTAKETRDVDVGSKSGRVAAELEGGESRDSKSIKIKRPLSPALLPPSKKAWPNRRLSSSSEFTAPSFNDTTTTDQSDAEFRIVALEEQLRQRKLEADRLRRKEKHLRKEKLRSKEQSLLKQLEAYDQYIKRITELLVENEKNLVDGAKPQIKNHSTAGEAHRQNEPSAEATGANDGRAAVATSSHFEEVETNTEDSEKQLRKADSGILIESEVTEPSENADPKPKSTAARSSETPASSANGVGEESKSSRDDDAAGGATTKSSLDTDNFLQAVNELHSEVQSLSEQLYSSDFVDEIPEDVADTKSDVSDSATRTSSVSIEEMFSDNRVVDVSTGGDERWKDGAKSSSLSSSDHQPLVFGIEDLEAIESESAAVGSRPSVEDAVGTSDSTAVEDATNVESSKADELSNGEIAARDEAQRTNEGSEVVGRNDASSDGEFGFANVRNVSDIDSEDVTICEEEAAAVEATLSEGEIPDDAGNSSSSRGLIKLNTGYPESEGSDAVEVAAEAVRPAVDEISTMMEGVRVSTASADVGKSSSSTRVKHNFDDVLRDLRSHFESKPAAVAAISEPIIDAADERSRDDVFEETDVSESLEYDAVPVVAYDDDVGPIPTHPITDLDDLEGKMTSAKNEMVSEEDAKESRDERDRSVDEFVEGHSIVPNFLGSTFVVDDDGELTFEKTLTTFDVDEELADMPTPECFRSGGGGGDDDDVVEADEAKNEKSLTYEDLEQIDDSKTPFLQALRRDSENYLPRRKESVAEKIVVDLLESLVEETTSGLVASLGPAKSSGAEIERRANAEPVDLQPTNEATNENDDVEKANDSSDADKNVDKFNAEWYNEKRLNYEEIRLREAEELRLRQMKIEQEIEELQAQQHIPPYVYLREIPNKPPPPYTPPTDSIATIPNNEAELRECVGSTIDYVCNNLEKGIDIDDIEEPESTKTDSKNREIISYKRFLFDLTVEIARSKLDESKTTTSLPWEELSKQRMPKPKPKRDELAKSIDDEIRVLFGYKSKINKEKSIIQWSRKKRTDFVDDLLIQELQEEENQWINYEKDELMIKNKITENLLDDLIGDTADSLKKASEHK